MYIPVLLNGLQTRFSHSVAGHSHKQKLFSGRCKQQT